MGNIDRCPCMALLALCTEGIENDGCCEEMRKELDSRANNRVHGLELFLSPNLFRTRNSPCVFSSDAPEALLEITIFYFNNNYFEIIKISNN